MRQRAVRDVLCCALFYLLTGIIELEVEIVVAMSCLVLCLCLIRIDKHVVGHGRGEGA
jgi:hypothetical protein